MKCIQFLLFIKEYLTDTNFTLTGDSDFLAFWRKMRNANCKRLQNGGALNFVQFFWTTLYVCMY